VQRLRLLTTTRGSRADARRPSRGARPQPRIQCPAG
jgi:hypothetical protein